MKFGIRECANIVFRAKQEMKIGNNTFKVGQPVLYIDSATTSTLEQSSETVYARGGRGNPQLIAWEGEKAVTFTVEDALLSPISLAMLSGADLFKGTSGTTEKVHFHTTSNAQAIYVEDVTRQGAYTGATAEVAGLVKMSSGAAVAVTATDVPVGSVVINLSTVLGDGENICAQEGTNNYIDAPIYAIVTEDDGSLTGTMLQGTVRVYGWGKVGDTAFDNQYVVISPSTGATDTGITANTTVFVDYYLDKDADQVDELQIAADNFAGYYYVEADTLWRRQYDGVDQPANITFPNIKIQSNFSFNLASTGDPSTFTFTMDAFPGYTYFDKSRKVLCVIQVVNDAKLASKKINPVMPHNEAAEHSYTDSDVEAEG